MAIDDAPVTRALIDQIQANAAGGRFAAFDTTIDATRYQVVVHLLYQSTRGRPLLGAVGFTVDRDWVAQHYFQEILEQISRIGQVDAGLSLGVSDEAGRTVGSTHPQAKREGVLHERRFPFSFIDADLIGDSLGSIPPALPWTLSVSAVDNRALAAAARGSTRTLWLTLLSAAVAIMGILLTLRALKAGADLTAMQSEFVASATHELKTPLAVFQLIADTLSKGRYGSEETIRVYGNMLAEQTQLLERLIDNVLAYASLAHVARRYDFQAVATAELVEAALERFDARLVAAGLDVTVDVAPGLPPIRADRASMLQALDNVIDNAITYSPPDQPLAIYAAARDRRVLLTISDRGPGIPSQEREKVFRSSIAERRSRLPAAAWASPLRDASSKITVARLPSAIPIRTARPSPSRCRPHPRRDLRAGCSTPTCCGFARPWKMAPHGAGRVTECSHEQLKRCGGNQPWLRPVLTAQQSAFASLVGAIITMCPRT